MRAAIADDFTGATDLAGNYVLRGLRSIVVLGVPDDELLASLPEHDVVVIALKTRSLPATEARSLAGRSVRVLLRHRYEQVYDKYCSTFDSTPEGNIGPVLDELLELTSAPRAVVVPAFPDNGRTVYQGYLFVHGQLLHESPMRDHPLNPMWDSRISRLLGPQTKHGIGAISLQTVRRGAEEVRRHLDELTSGGIRYVVVDAVDNDDLAIIAAATANEKLVSGGSGLALGTAYVDGPSTRLRRLGGKRLILSGSASVTTQRQVQAAKCFPSIRLDVAAYLERPETEVDRLLTWADEHWRESVPVLIYSVGRPSDVHRFDPHGNTQVLEDAFAKIACAATCRGVRELIIAGGETSGAVLTALGVRILQVGQQLSPGVSWLRGVTADGDERNFVLKSGNFGSDTLFVDAWKELD